MSKPCRTCGGPRAKHRSQCLSCYGKERRSTDSGAGTVTRVSTWQVLKGDEVVTLKSERRSMKPAAVSIEEYLRPAAPVNVTLNVSPILSERPFRQAVVLLVPDVQIGYRRLDDDSLEAFHDEAAMAAAIQFAADLRPDTVVHLGDLIDFAPLSRFASEPGFAGTTQLGIDRSHRFLAEMRAATPGSFHWLIEGNHDVRAQRFMAKAAPELARVRAPGARWPALSVPSLLRLDELEVEYVSGYPAARLWLRDDLAVRHGDKVNSSGSTAALEVRDALECRVLGHVHRREFHARSFDTLAGPRTVWAASPGTLSRVDGAVPSFHSGVSGATGASIPRQESWQQGVGVIRLIEGVTPIWEQVPIENGVAYYGARQYGAA